jgi:nicotinic acid mononucleotide adenylyltransferase
LGNPDPVWIADCLAGLSPTEPPQLVFLRRAPEGIGALPGTLLCLSASFNPMTVAHAALVREGSRLVSPQEVLLLLATANVDKYNEGLPLERRFDLLLRFAESRPRVSVAAVHHGRFVDKLDAIRAAYPDATRVVFVLGFDTVVRLFAMKYYDDRDTSLARLFTASECVIANRGENTPNAVDAFLARPEVAPFAHRIHVVRLPMDVAAVSATEVRHRLSRGGPVAGLVPSEMLPALSAWGQHLPGG